MEFVPDAKNRGSWQSVTLFFERGQEREEGEKVLVCGGAKNSAVGAWGFWRCAAKNCGGGELIVGTDRS